MAKPRNATLSETIYNKIDKNDYLQEIYETILFNYSMKLIHEQHRNRPINMDHALRFADVLSKSSGHPNSEKHKTWAQEIVALLNALYPNDTKVRAYASSVLASIGNYRGLDLIKTKYKNTSFLDELYENFDLDYLTIPYQDNKYFFHSQKKIYNHFDDISFSYSGPTSMGKSLLMRMFIKDKVLHGYKGNFAILVPTKALITEISSGILKEDLKEDLAGNHYKVVTSGNSLFLKQNGINCIMVLTPERLLYLLMSYPDISIDYLFIDEAHKINEKDGRSVFYYKVTDMLVQRERKPHVILASPNIPNPQEFFNALPEEQRINENFITTSFTPVSQMKYIVDLLKGEFSIYNERSNKKDPFIKLEDLHSSDYFEVVKRIINLDNSKSNIVYCSGKERTVEFAREYATGIKLLNDPELDKLAKEIKDEIHDDYYLVDLIKKGVAYHVGYLPLHIRTTIEENYRKGLIKTIFCTSTLIEGVNLPADNLFVISYKNGKHKMSQVEFKNLLGRVGRIKYNLYGNVFIIRHSTQQSEKTIKEMLTKEVPEQKISLTSGLNDFQKKHIVDCLIEGKSEFSMIVADDSKTYDLMRKVGLILLRDITKDRNSVIKKEFEELLNEDNIMTIKSKFINNNDETKPKPDDDINVSVDQTERLIIAIKQGLEYPALVNSQVDYDDLVDFLRKLSSVFKWNIYEPETLGKGDKIEYYAVILVKWMNGEGLKQILNSTIKHNKTHNCQIMHYGRPINYDDSTEHRNILIGETLGNIENIILFSVANYFLRFSTEYKRLRNNGQPFDNDWYEYVEFGSTNELTIFLQRNGLSRDTADYIREHKSKYVVNHNNVIKLKKEILDCGKQDVMDELKDVQYNIPEIFE